MTVAEQGAPSWLQRLAALSPAALLISLVALALTVVYGELPARPAILHVIEKLGHPGVFGVASILMLALAHRGSGARPAWREYALSLGACALLGGATELAQTLSHRSPALGDVGLDLEGALCALAAAWATDGRLAPAPERLRRSLAWGTSAVLAILIAVPLLVALAAYANRGLAFPVLFAPRGALDLYFLQVGHQSAGIGRSTDAPDGQVLRVMLRDRPFAGIILAEPSPDWRAYRTLRVVVTNPGAAPLTFNVRVDDLHGGDEYEDRYNGASTVAAGTRRTIDIPLATIASGPRDRTLDLGAIARIVLFRSGIGPDEFDLERIELK